MKKWILLIAGAVVFSACSSTPEKDSLAWFADNVPLLAVEKAVAVQDYRVYAYARRAIVIPSKRFVSVSDVKRYCGLNIVKTLGDVLPKDKALRELRREAEDFIKVYNREMLAHCMQRRG